jgi:hypothetical protein
MVEANQITGTGEYATVSIHEETAFQKATRIVVRPIDSLLLHVENIREVFEKSLSKMGILQQGRLYPIPLEEFDGMVVSFFTEVTEPENEVFLDGDSIPLEFEESLETVAPQTPAPAPASTNTSPTTSVQGAITVPSQILTSEIQEELQATTPKQSGRKSFAPKGYIPFSGEGRRLNE